MSEDQLLARIVLDPEVITGKPVIRGTRLTVEHILNLMAHGATAAEITAEHDGLSLEDIQACLLFAAQSLGDTAFMPLGIERPDAVSDGGGHK